MGTVLRARRKDEEVAVKMIRPTLLDNADIRARFEREAELLQSVENPHVARIVGFDASKKTAPWLATEFIDGPNLRDLIKEKGKLAELEWRDLAEGILDGLKAIHSKGIIHRDIKPANIMMSATGPKIIDFGISKEEGQTAFTQTQMFAGTVAYLAPERAESGEESQASDIYSAGLVLALAAQGEHPFGDETTQSELAILMKMATEPPTLSEVSEFQRKFLSSLLNRDPLSRPDAGRALAILRGEEELIAPIVETKARPLAGRSIPRPRRSGFIVNPQRSWIRGAFVALAPLLLTFGVALVHHTESGAERFLAALYTATGVIADAHRITPIFLEFGWILDENSVYATELSIRPLGLLLLQAGVIFYFGTRYAGAMKAANRQQVTHHVVALFSPPVLLITALSWTPLLLSYSSPSGYPVAGLMPWDTLLPLGVFALAFLGGLVRGGLADRRSIASWWLNFAGRFSLLAAAAASAALVGSAAYIALSPDFSYSVTRSGASPFTSYDFPDYLVLSFWLLSIVPVLLSQWLAATVAQSADVAMRVDNHLYIQALALRPEESIWESLVPRNAFFASAFVLTAAVLIIVAATQASRDTQRSILHRTALIQVSSLTGAFFFLTFFLNAVGVTGGEGIRGNFLLHGSRESMLLMAGVLAILTLLALAIMAFSATKSVQGFISRFFPSLSSATSGAIVSAKLRSRRPVSEFLAIVVASLLLISVIAAPASFGVAERVIAEQNTPLRAATDFADALQIQDGPGLRELFSSDNQGLWFTDSVLESAQPPLGTKVTATITNNQGKKWTIGNMDANGVLSWKIDGETVEWSADFESSLNRAWGYVRYPEYTLVAKPVTVRVNVDEEANAIPDARLTVNGQTVSSGTFLSIPGRYEFSRDGVLLLASFSETMHTTNLSEEVNVPSVLDLPSGADETLSEAIDTRTEKCGTIWSPNCYEREEIDRNLTVISGRKPSSYFDSSSSGLTDGGIRCWDGDDVLLSPSEMVRSVKCEQTVNSQTTYYDSRRIAEPVYSVRCARYYYSFWFGFTCLRYETYQSGTTYRTVRGSELATVKYRSEIPFIISVPGSIDEAGQFSIGEVRVD